MFKITKSNNMSVNIVVQNNDLVIFFLPGRFLADVTKQVLSDLEASKYQVWFCLFSTKRVLQALKLQSEDQMIVDFRLRDYSNSCL